MNPFWLTFFNGAWVFYLLLTGAVSFQWFGYHLCLQYPFSAHHRCYARLIAVTAMSSFQTLIYISFFTYFAFTMAANIISAHHYTQYYNMCMYTLYCMTVHISDGTINVIASAVYMAALLNTFGMGIRIMTACCQGLGKMLKEQETMILVSDSGDKIQPHSLPDTHSDMSPYHPHYNRMHQWTDSCPTFNASILTKSTTFLYSLYLLLQTTSCK